MFNQTSTHIYWNYVTKAGEVVHLYVVIRERENGMRDHMCSY